jgi:aryl-alcohol dehydrogenase-like predicted oxidoreductase
MKQETLEEVAERYSANELSQLGFINGAKWQQEQDKNKYSLEDMKKAFEDGQENMDYSEMYGWSSKLTTEEWFEQFKKK